MTLDYWIIISFFKLWFALFMKLKQKIWATKADNYSWGLAVNFTNILCTNFFVQTSFWQLISSYMYVEKAFKTMFVLKIQIQNSDVKCWWNWHQGVTWHFLLFSDPHPPVGHFTFKNGYFKAQKDLSCEFS